MRCRKSRDESRLSRLTARATRAAALLPLLLPIAWSATSTAWETTGYNDFLKGSLHGLALTSDGVVRPGPAVIATSVVDQPALWTAVLAPDGSVNLGTGHRGKVYRVASDGSVKLVWTAPQPEVFALCVGKDGTLYAGSSPDGSIYRIANGKATELFHPPAKYIWALAAAPQGGLYAATGDQGRIYYVGESGKGEVYYETGQQHVTSLAVGPQGDLYAGSDPGGLLFQITAQGKGTILFHSPLPEVHGLAVEGDGTVYASALGGSLTSRNASQAAASATGAAAVASLPTVVSVSDEAATPAQVGDLKPGTGRGTATSTLTPVTAATAGTTAEISGVDRSAIYRINPDRTVETLRSSKDDNVFDLLLNGTKLLFSTDQQGRLYQLEPDRRVTLVAELGDSEAVRLIRKGTELLAAQSAPAKLVSLTLGAASGAHAAAQYESAVHDAGSVARWGHLSWRAQGGAIAVRTRTGNSPLPDATWSEWSEALSVAAGSPIKSPTARYIQWRADWPAGSAAELSSATVSLLPQNTPPAVRSISVTTLNAASAAKSASASANSPYSVTVTDSSDATAAAGATPQQAISRQNSTQMQIAWQADDADGDKLIFDLYFRGEGESEWKLIRSQISDYSLLLDPDVLADGRYWFKVVASDRPSNAREYARETEFISPPVVIDNTPPVVVPGAVTRHEDRVEIDLTAEDKSSPLRRFEYAVDAGPWLPVEATDGVTDSLKESFHVQLDKLKPGEHLIVFRAYDSAGNVGLSKVVVHQ